MKMNWEYYTLIDGRLCDDDGHDCFPGTRFASVADADLYLVENDIRGTVR